MRQSLKQSGSIVKRSLRLLSLIGQQLQQLIHFFSWLVHHGVRVLLLTRCCLHRQTITIREQICW
jgi:hypothetical protein